MGIGRGRGIGIRTGKTTETGTGTGIDGNRKGRRTEQTTRRSRNKQSRPRRPLTNKLIRNEFWEGPASGALGPERRVVVLVGLWVSYNNRVPKDHTNTRISHSGSKANMGGYHQCCLVESSCLCRLPPPPSPPPAKARAPPRAAQPVPRKARPLLSGGPAISRGSMGVPKKALHVHTLEI